MNEWDMRPHILAALRCEGSAIIHTGVMPAGWLEEELSTWLDALAQ